MLPRRALRPAHLRLCIRCRSDAHLRRFIQTSAQKRALVGPPDPAKEEGKDKEGDGESSAGAVGNSSRTNLVENTRTSPTHPYQLDEFNGDPADYTWRLERNRLDAYNHAFWKDSNTRFEVARQAVLSSLPESATPEAREAALSEFYGKWLQQEHERLREYSNEWNRRNFTGILLAARAAISRFRARIFGEIKSPRPSSQ